MQSIKVSIYHSEWGNLSFLVDDTLVAQIWKKDDEREYVCHVKDIIGYGYGHYTLFFQSENEAIKHAKDCISRYLKYVGIKVEFEDYEC